ncbi:MAG: Rpn family recombination-promoting nuclease/putative transposase [Treponema sp.]|nr:Rpn family recombination-promoting nuclease/putative transposase [Treponema sp.]
MADKDVLEKTLESYNDVFADIVNGFLFHGKQVIKEEDLTDAQTFSMYKADKKSLAQDRDVAKYWQKGRIRLSFIGLENQTEPDANMPLRVIGYDGAAYRAQLQDDGHSELYPVLTLVLYFGTKKRWKTARTLKGRLKSIPPELKPFINDYKINVFELAWADDKTIGAFKSDFRDVLEFLRCKRMRVRYAGTDRQLQHVHEVLELLRLISADDTFTRVEPELIKRQTERGGTSMCDVVDMIRKEGFASGERQGFANGERQGFANGERQGFADGRDSLYTILTALQAEGRSDELIRVLSDRSYMEKLLAEQKR